MNLVLDMLNDNYFIKNVKLCFLYISDLVWSELKSRIKKMSWWFFWIKKEREIYNVGGKYIIKSERNDMVFYKINNVWLNGLIVFIKIFFS